MKTRRSNPAGFLVSMPKRKYAQSPDTLKPAQMRSEWQPAGSISFDHVLRLQQLRDLTCW
jgi:hypothetical protein